VSRASANRISHLAHLILEALRKDKLADFSNEGRALAETKQVLTDFLQGEDHIDELVRRKILSLSRHVPPGSREWDVLYRKYYEEEMRKLKK
jgi:uncharacterized protein